MRWIFRSLLIAAAATPALVMAVAGSHPVQLPGWSHFIVVGGAAAVATTAAIALGVAGAVFDDARAAVVGVAFAVMAAILCLHGATTPGFLVGTNGVVALTGAGTLPLGLAILVSGGARSFGRDALVRWVAVAGAGLIVLVLGVGGAALLLPEAVPTVPRAGSAPALALLAFGLAAAALLVRRAVRTSRLTHRLADLSVAIGIVWLGTSLAGALLMDYAQLGWWFGHGLEIAGMGLVGGPVAVDLHRGARSRPLFGDFRAVELVSSAEDFLGPYVRALLVSLASKDTSTEQHTRRVALLAVRIGEELGLGPARLRHLALGGLLHDIGKLSVPSEILDKPGALDEDEIRQIQLHPAAGVEILDSVSALPETVMQIVRDHHERLDGSGYPAGLAREQVSLEARIVAVCDVYDALVSDRVYRPAWTPERALALLHAESAHAFDPAVVAVLARLVGPAQSELAIAV